MSEKLVLQDNYLLSDNISIFPISHRAEAYQSQRMISEHNLTRLVESRGHTSPIDITVTEEDVDTGEVVEIHRVENDGYVIDFVIDTKATTMKISFVLYGYYIEMVLPSLPSEGDDNTNLYALIWINNATFQLIGSDDNDGYYRGVKFILSDTLPELENNCDTGNGSCFMLHLLERVGTMWQVPQCSLKHIDGGEI